jgi:acetolactate synthase I/II/III large subunit
VSNTSRDLPRADRRKFLKGAALTGAAALTPAAATAQAAPPRTDLKAAAPGPKLVAAETLPPGKDPVNQTSSGGEFMVDVLKALDLEYLAMNCASSFRGVHEAIVNYGGNKPEILTCPHEEIAVHMAQGYAKIEGKPIGMICHGTVGLQHASMAMYNAWCDRVPVYVMIGNIIEADKRAPGAEWVHSAIDPAALVRDFVKWDDQPASLQHFAESAVRAYKVATTPPMGPVLLSLDAELQENPIADRSKLRIPKVTKVVPPVADAGALGEAARLLASAENPVIICDRMTRTPAGMARLVELAETLQCAVVDQGGRLNFPTRHPLNQTFRSRAVISQADVVLAIEMNDLCGDGEASLPALTEHVKRLVDEVRRSAYQARGEKLAKAKLALVERTKSDATIAWDASPITTARMCAEVYAQIKDEDWSLVGNAIRNTWPLRLWNFDKTYRWNGFSGGAGVGYNAPASVGAALANKRHGRLTVAFGGDGDLMFVPSTLWTAAHHRIPLLYIVHNNRAYHQEYMYLVAMAARLGRGIDNSEIGTVITDPHVDYATVARGFGVHGEGPISDPAELAPALKRALAVVKSGQPALVDVVTDPR